MSEGRIGILGAGNMGRALIGGLLRTGVRAGRIAAADAAPAARAALAREFGVEATAGNQAACAGAEAVVLAVKPADAPGVLRELAATLRDARPLVISVAAGVRLAVLEEACGPGVPVMRAMPNRPALLGAGVTGLYAPPSVDAGRRALAERVLRPLGEIVWLPQEESLDVVTAVSGSGPAYFFLLAELMAAAGTRLGLDPAVARRLAALTLSGAGRMVESGDADLGALRAAVTSPGGTTAAALAAFEAAGLAGAVNAAVAAATQRGRELAGG